jgi:hypothetical protein
MPTLKSSHKWILVYLIFIVSLSVSNNGQTLDKNADKEKGIKLIADEAARRVDVIIDGKPFTSYIFPKNLKKPALYPLRTSTGTLVTRGFPMEPRPGERVDHPHHVGLWLNYGDVNGVDFWNNSDERSTSEQSKMGTVLHRRVVGAKDGKEEAQLEVEADWIMPDGRPILNERTRYIFSAKENLRIIDRTTTLTALDKRVIFKDNKEGLLGLRLARFLEHPSDKAEVFTDSSGRPTKVSVLNNEGVTGLYQSSRGKSGDEVWATRSEWVMLTGETNGEKVTLVIMDHKKNPNHPTYWHARGYGLFAANPLGQKIFAEAKNEPKINSFNLTLEPKESITFKFRVLIASGNLDQDKIKSNYEAFNKN